jgi:hypothetical protein
MAFDRLTLDLFKSTKISRNELDLFTADFLKRIQAKGTDLLPQSQVNTLINSYQNFKANLGLQANKEALQKGGTLSRKDAFENVIAFIRRQEGLIKSKFGKPSPVYLEFFPQGLTEYSQAKVEGLTNLLVRFVAATHKHKSDLGQDFLTEITQLQTSYTNARDDQGTSIAANKSIQSEVRDTRKELTLLLTKAVLVIAAGTLENAEQFNSYFNFGLLLVDNNNPLAQTEPKA